MWTLVFTTRVLGHDQKEFGPELEPKKVVPRFSAHVMYCSTKTLLLNRHIGITSP